MAKKQTTVDKVYKRIQLVGTSAKSFEAAVENAVKRSAETLSDLRWFEVKELRGKVDQTGILEYQAVVVVAFEVK